MLLLATWVKHSELVSQRQGLQTEFPLRKLVQIDWGVTAMEV